MEKHFAHGKADLKQVPQNTVWGNPHTEGCNRSCQVARTQALAVRRRQYDLIVRRLLTRGILVRSANLREVYTPNSLGMLIKGHGLCMLADIPQLNDAFIV